MVLDENCFMELISSLRDYNYIQKLSKINNAMINFKPRKYLIIDPKQVLAGETTTKVIDSGDLVITEFDDGISLVLKQGASQKANR